MGGESSEHPEGTAATEHVQSLDAVSRARMRGKRVALSLVVAVAVAFVGASAAQIIPAVFGFGIRPLPPASLGTRPRTCGDGILALAAAIDGSGGALPDWDQAAEPIARACAASSEGLDAWAALIRLRSARLQLPRDHDAELAALRRNVDAHIAAQLR
jgi:hypothetical protein